MLAPLNKTINNYYTGIAAKRSGLVEKGNCQPEQ